MHPMFRRTTCTNVAAALAHGKLVSTAPRGENSAAGMWSLPWHGLSMQDVQAEYAAQAAHTLYPPRCPIKLHVDPWPKII